MFALRRRQEKQLGPGRRPAPAAEPSPESFVLPKWLRKPARIIERAGDLDQFAPRFAATIMTVSYLSLASLYGMVVGGHTPAVVQALTSRAGFAIDEVKISGHRETSEIDILEKLGLDGWTSMIGFDALAARAEIAALPWVATAEIKKTYPGTVEIKITEKKPYAIWQSGRELMLVEKTGAPIAPFAGDRYATLPLVIGVGAAPRAAEFVEKMERHPELASRVKGYIRVADRRWDLRLENGVTVMLPEGDETAALDSLVDMERESGLLGRDILAVDLRLDDRVVVELTPEAVMRRNAALSEQMKKKKTERHI